MLWELKQLEKRREDIERDIAQAKRDTSLSPKSRAERLADLNREDTLAYIRRQHLLSLISQDRQLSKKLDQERELARIKPLPEAQQGLRETPGQLPAAQEQRLKLRAHMRQWHEKSVTERNIEASRFLEQEQGSEWEPD